MKAILKGRVIAESEDVVESGGYAYFPRQAVRMEWLKKAVKTQDDKAYPHGVQFYDVTVDGVRAERAAWCYEAPLESMKPVGGRFGFWGRVEVVRSP